MQKLAALLGAIAGLGLIVVSTAIMITSRPQTSKPSELELWATIQASQTDEAKAQALQAQAQVDAIEEEGEADVNRTVAHTDAYVRRLLTETNVELATAQTRRRDSWRLTAQILLVLLLTACAGGASFGFASSYLQNREGPVCAFRCVNCDHVWQSTVRELDVCPSCEADEAIIYPPSP